MNSINNGLNTHIHALTALQNHRIANKNKDIIQCFLMKASPCTDFCLAYHTPKRKTGNHIGELWRKYPSIL